MDLSFDWLSEYVDPGCGADEVARRLTALGLAVEEQRVVGGDRIFNIDITTNRPDCMCHLGTAREVAAVLDRPLRRPSTGVDVVDRHVTEAAAVEVQDPAGCRAYVARVVEGVRVGPSPEWLVRRLEAIGQRSINNIVDVTNFVLWELGQPIHAFDLATLKDSKIVVRRARSEEPLKTLDGVERQLGEDVLVIADSERAVALAGIMGGLETEVSNSTVDVLIESAHFDPARVRQGARRLGVHTDASHRFERGADPLGCREAADRVAALIIEVAGGRVLDGAIEIVDESADWSLRGRIDLARAERFAGAHLEAEQVENWLASLGFSLHSESSGVWSVEVPSWRYYDMRPDPTIVPGQAQKSVFEADLFEEIVRLNGFDGIPATLPAVGGPDEGSTTGYDRRQAIRQELSASGYLEAINLAFHDAEAGDRFPTLGSERRNLYLANPLSELFTVMRRSLLPGLVASAQFNQRRGAKSIRLFEIGHVFPGDGDGEIETVALIAGGIGGTPWQRPRDFDFFDLKAAIERLIELAGPGVRVVPSRLPGLVDGTGATLLLDAAEHHSGFLGQLDLPDSPYPLYVAEIRTAGLQRSGVVTVELPSRFPAVEADLTLTHSTSIPWSEIVQAIRGAQIENMVDFALADRYRGEGVPDGAVNTTIGFVYNAADRSLTQDEVNEKHEAIRHLLEDRFGWRGTE